MNPHTTQQPVISVIVPCRGQLQQLRVSAPPLLADESVEYILVDHNCPDWCGNFARAYWPVAKVVEVAQVEHFNWGHACNAGARTATGRWLAFLDSAVVVAEQFATKVRALLNEEVLIDGSPPEESASAVGGDDPNLLLCSATAFARAGGYDPQLAEGRLQARDLRQRLLAQGLRRACLPREFFRVLGPPVEGETDPLCQLRELWAGKDYPSWVRWPNPITVGIVGPGFGDVFKGIRYAYYLQQEHRLEVSLYPLWHGFRRMDFRKTPHVSREALAREIMEVLDVPSPLPLDTSKPIDEVYVPDGWPWHFHPQVPTKLRWQGWPKGHHRRIAYQFDASSSAEVKNPSSAEQQQMLNFAPGYEMVPLGKHLSVQQCVEIASACDLFVGVDSGMMHLCYAVGVPAFLLCNQVDPLVLFKWHGSSHAIYCFGAQDFIHKATQFLGLDSG
jgi:hypothetical protein